MTNKIKISPSILSADFSNLGNEIELIDKAGADMIHVDVMDGIFVPNITIGPEIIKSLKKHTKKPFDVHLMIHQPEKWINTFVEAGADVLTLHIEAVEHIHKAIKKIKNLGIRAGVSLNPSTSEKDLEYILEECDLILVMSVNPGFGGQSFIDNQLTKVERIKKMILKHGYKAEIEVDGGVNKTNARSIISAGASILVAGNSVFKDGPERYFANIRSLRNGN